ncbi:hypothetical protein BSKO_04542 [Bryopsis sp. KO-2023]|nr:hypothetical protein BSKO_04542 [Bryopsis sp. KO-2023]
MEGASPRTPASQVPSTARRSPFKYHYTSSVTMYESIPDGEVAIEDFEHLAIDRLKVLRAIDDGRSARKQEDQIQERVQEVFNESMKGGSPKEALLKDSISHYALRLAFCQTEDLRRWFLSQECDLFIWRFNAMPSNERVLFLGRHFEYEEISTAEFREVKDRLAAVFRSLFDQKTATAVMNEEYKMFYKVPFERVPELVAGRKVFLKKGFAYVPRDQVVSLVVGHFRTRLSKALTMLAHHWSSQVAPMEMERLVPIVEALKNKYIGPDYDGDGSENKASVSLKQIPVLARKHFPLCMQHLFDRLTVDHHLRHNGRQQLSLFLKGIGLPLGESLQFWKVSMAPKVPGDKFEKEYAYNIRHNYGKEGKRKDYTPYPCMRIISMTPGVGEHHGCPYKTFTEPQLRAALGKLKIGAREMDEAVSKARGSHFQLACAAAFEGASGCPCDTGINHPNQYFEESRKAEVRISQMEIDNPSTPVVSRQHPALQPRT